MNKAGFGVIGVGVFGQNHALTYGRVPEADLVAICDLNRERAEAIAEQYGAREVYTDYREMLEKADIAAVSVATPDFAHREVAVACAEAGKHLLVEKPLAQKVKDAEAIIAAAEKAGVKLMVDFHNRVSPPFVSAKEAVTGGEIGRLAYVYARLSNTTYVATQMLSWADRSSALWFLASHTTDLTCWLLEDEPVRVYAVTRDGILKEKGIDTQDFHVAIVEFAGGAVATLENAWILPETQNLVHARMELLGSKGSIYVNSSEHRAIQVYSSEGVALPDVLGMTPTGPTRTGGFITESIARFVDAVVYDQPVLATGADGLRVTRVLNAITESARTGEPVDL